jgi:hypothetical protein
MVWAYFHSVAVVEELPMTSRMILKTDAGASVNRHSAIPELLHYRQLLKSIQKEKLRIVEWQHIEAEFKSAVRRDLVPLVQTIFQLKAQLVRLLDSVLGHAKFSKRDQRFIINWIDELATAVLQNIDDDEVTEIHLRRCPRRRPAGGLDELDADNLEEMLQDMESEFAETFSDTGERHTQETHARSNDTPHAQKHADDEARTIADTFRNIYRRLASALHPDREPDASALAAKTEKLKAVNVAYANNDFLTLLEIQNELLQHSTVQNNHTPGQLRCINTLLAEQLQSLRNECKAIQQAICVRNLRKNASVKTATLTIHIAVQSDRDNLQADIESLQWNLREFRSISYLKYWIKAQQQHEVECW